MNNNKINRLLDEKFVLDFFNNNVLLKYPQFKSIKKITIKPIKNHVWHETYHVVFSYKVVFLRENNERKEILIFCSAHSSEPRENIYDVLEHLWHKGFNHGQLTIPRPLFFSQEFNATFYQGVKGDNLKHYLSTKEFDKVEKLLVQSAKWLSKLHKLSIVDTANFSEPNSRLRTVFPGYKRITDEINEVYPELRSIYKKLYESFMENEETFLNSTDKRWLIHGDAHPENVIKIGNKKMAFVDFTDMSLSDFARDLGTFMQQLEYMSNRLVKDNDYTEKIKELFLTNYLSFAKIKIDTDLMARIDNYYNWTAIRTATFFLMKHNPEPARARVLIDQICNKLNIELNAD